MHARRSTVPLFALTFGLSLAALAGASADSSPAAEAPKTAAKTCCDHHGAAGDKTGMHCDHAKMKAAGETGEACCAQHAKMHAEGAASEGKAACPHHAGMMKDAATADAGDAKACCAQHAAMHKDGEKAGCCCCSGEACEHPAKEAAPAKS